MCLTWPALTDADIDANKPEDYCLDCHNKDAEITMLTLEKSSYAQLLDDAKHNIVRLNAVIRAMAEGILNRESVPAGVLRGGVPCIIDHFTREQEAKDDRDK